MTVREYIKTKKLKGGDWLTVIVSGKYHIATVDDWDKGTNYFRFMELKCKENRKQVIEILL